MRIQKNFALETETAQWLEDHKEINQSKLINNLLKRHIKELLNPQAEQ